jgi:hypothetical protein
LDAAVLLASSREVPPPPAADQPPASRAEAVAALAATNVSYHMVVSFLLFLGHVYYCITAFWLLRQPQWPNSSKLGSQAALLAQARLWPLADPAAPPRAPIDIPWSAVAACIRLLAKTSLVLLTPVYVMMLAGATALMRRRLPLALYEPLFAGGMAVEMLSFAATDAAVVLATGCICEWAPLGPGLIQAVGMLVMDRHGPFTARTMRALFTLKAATLILPPLLARRPRILMQNAHYAAQLAMLALNAALAGRREAAVVAGARKKRA